MIETLLEVQLKEKDDFLKIAETLTRIGIVTKDDKLIQTCHILHKRGKYYICHFRELFKLDGYDRDVTNDDIERRNAIATLLDQWGLCSIVDSEKALPAPIKKVKVISHKDKHKYTLKSNYTVGNHKARSV